SGRGHPPAVKDMRGRRKIYRLVTLLCYGFFTRPVGSSSFLRRLSLTCHCELVHQQSRGISSKGRKHSVNGNCGSVSGIRCSPKLITVICHRICYAQNDRYAGICCLEVNSNDVVKVRVQ